MSRRNRFCSIAAMATFDAVFVGSGINSLVGAALLARDGWSVCVLERNDVAGGCIRTSTDLTLPGFTHEVLASWHPLFTGSAAYAELKDELDRRAASPTSTPTSRPELPSRTARRRSSRARSRGTWRSSTDSPPATAPPGSASSTRSWPTPISRSGSSRRSSGRRRGSRSAARRSGASAAAGCSSSPATRSSAVATGSRRRSSRRPRTASSRRGCCTRASARIRRRPAS